MEVFSMIVSLLSGVAMFLYGMMLMKLVAGNKLWRDKMTNTLAERSRAWRRVTCVIQSSATR